MQFVFPITVLKHCFQFLLGLTNLPWEIEIKSYAKFCRGSKLHCGKHECHRFPEIYILNFKEHLFFWIICINKNIEIHWIIKYSLFQAPRKWRKQIKKSCEKTMQGLGRDRVVERGSIVSSTSFWYPCSQFHCPITFLTCLH